MIIIVIIIVVVIISGFLRLLLLEPRRRWDAVLADLPLLLLLAPLPMVWLV